MKFNLSRTALLVAIFGAWMGQEASAATLTEKMCRAYGPCRENSGSKCGRDYNFFKECYQTCKNEGDFRASSCHAKGVKAGFLAKMKKEKASSTNEVEETTEE